MPTCETAADLRGPYNGGAANKDGTWELAVVALTGSSQNVDLSGANYFNGTHYLDKFVRIISDTVDCTYFWSNNSSATVSTSATDGTNKANQGDFLPAKERREEAPAGQYLVIIGASGKVHLSITNQVSR